MNLHMEDHKRPLYIATTLMRWQSDPKKGTDRHRSLFVVFSK